MKWSPQQDAALKAVAEWLRRGAPQVFRLFGYAGTGKTTLARHVAEGVEGEVAFGAFTGKAALVMRARGCRDASTIHSMIYRSRESDEGGPSFVLNRSSVASKVALIAVDECSMVDEELGRDLLSFGNADQVEVNSVTLTGALLSLNVTVPAVHDSDTFTIIKVDGGVSAIIAA